MSIGDWLLNPTGLTPHGFCLSWSPGLVAIHAGSDAVIGLAYFSIPLAISSFTRQREDFKFGWVAYLFVAFILACGSTHLWSILTLWVPAYGVEGLIKVITALLSIATAILLWPLIPNLLAVPSTARLERMNAELAAVSVEQTHTAQLLRASEANLQSANLDLERRVTERTTELVALNDQLNHIWSMNSLGAMAAVLAHELNQPLAAISNYAQGARTLIAQMESHDERLLDAVEKVGNQAIRAGEIIRRMRDLVPSNDSNQSQEDLAALIVEVDFMVALVAREAGVTVLYDLAEEPERVMVDRIQIQQVILNLVRNAVEATRLSSMRVVQISSSLSDGFWTVSVDDSGTGVSEQVADQLFMPITSTKTQGMGLGLSLSKTIIEQHGGRIWAGQSRYGGASFQFQLPACP